MMLRNERDIIAKRNDDKLRIKAFAIGLVYDALTWTPGKPGIQHLSVLTDITKVLEKNQMTEEDFKLIRNQLNDGGFHTTPGIISKE